MLNQIMQPKDIVRRLAQPQMPKLSSPKDRVRSLLSNDQSATSQFFRKDTFNQAKEQLYSGKYNPLTYTKKFGEFLAPDPNRSTGQKAIDNALNYSPMGVGGTVRKLAGRIHPQDVDIIDTFSDYVRSGLAKIEPNLKLELDASRIAEKHVGGGKQPKDLSTLANRLQTIIKKTEK